MFVLQGATYHFRRRVPRHLMAVLGRAEVWQSLRTSSVRIARARAAMLYAITERVFAMDGGMNAKAELDSLMRAAEEMIARGEDASDLLQRIERGLDRREVEVARAGAFLPPLGLR